MGGAKLHAGSPAYPMPWQGAYPGDNHDNAKVYVM